MNFPPTDKARYERLRQLTPVEAVRAWIAGSFGIGDESALVEAIRKDRRVTLSESKISGRMIEWMEAAEEGELNPETDAADCLEKLAKKS